MHVEADGVLAVAVAHVVVRGSWWRGPILAVCNVAYIGDWNVAPRAHPNDGRFDVVMVASGMSVRHRWQARTRLALGTHVPHPDITIRTGTEASWEFERPRRVWIDGVEWGEVSALTVTIEPDAYTLYV
jgi:diacylglycerol kinase family enzyme